MADKPRKNTNNKDYNIVQDILNKTNEEIEKMDNVNILICGKTGSGKSTLINSVFRENLADTGIGKPVTQHLRKISKEDMPLVLYDTRGLELDEDIQRQVFEEINDLHRKTKGTKDELNICYYCINAGANRIEPMEIELIRQICQHIPVIVVLTMSIGEPARELKSYIDNLNLPMEGIVNVMAKEYKINDKISIEPFGLKELVGLTFDSIPEETRKAFNNAQQADIQKKADQASRWARRYVTAAFGVGFTPIPFADASILVPMQVSVIAHITAIFGISLDKSSVISLVAAVGGTGGATYLGRTIVSNILKFVPGTSAATGVISGTTAAVITSALATSYIKVLTIVAEKEFETGQSHKGLIGDLMKKEYKKALKKSSKEAKEKLDSEDMLSPQDEESIMSKIRNKLRRK